MGNTLEYVLLGILQGLTEFLPVSSSGHLALAEKWLGVAPHGLLTSTCLHFGTLLAILFVFRRQVRELLVDGVRGMVLWARGRSSEIPDAAPQFPLAVAVAVGTIPAAVAGLTLTAVGTGLMHNTMLVGCLLIATGLILLAARFVRKGDNTEVTARTGFMIGLAQAAALAPGISRSGATIVAGYAVGLERETAARFSFLLAIPAIAGAMAIETVSQATGTAGALTSSDVFGLACGTLAAALVGWVCLVVLFRIVRRGELHWFAAYCIPLGIAVVLSEMLGGGPVT